MMLRSPETRSVVLLAALTAQLSIALAGSRIWQPRITKFDHVATLDGLTDGILSRRMSDNLTTTSTQLHSPDRRWLINNQEYANLWPDATIRYCFKTQADKDAIFDDLKEALNRWWSSGLDQSVFKWVEVDEDTCNNERSTVLLISLNQGDDVGAGHLATVGRYPASTDEGIDGPFLEIDPNDWGPLDKIGTIAHELGHVFGLYHEQQNPNFWSNDFAQGNSGTVFTKENFHCEAIDGYEDAVESITEDGGDVATLCTDRAVARKYKFQASEFLPLPVAQLLAPPGHGPEDVDWDSIMIYDSGASAEDPDVPVYTKPDKSLIKEIKWPSPLDIVGINTLYRTGPQTTEDLLNMKSNPKSDLFKQIYGEGKGEESC